MPPLSHFQFNNNRPSSQFGHIKGQKAISHIDLPTLLSACLCISNCQGWSCIDWSEVWRPSLGRPVCTVQQHWNMHKWGKVRNEHLWPTSHSKSMWMFFILGDWISMYRQPMHACPQQPWQVTELWEVKPGGTKNTVAKVCWYGGASGHSSTHLQLSCPHTHSICGHHPPVVYPVQVHTRTPCFWGIPVKH